MFTCAAELRGQRLEFNWHTEKQHFANVAKYARIVQKE
jgi:hypothetical protein